MDKLDPQCFKNNIAFAVTNRGELIPCCMCDDPPTINDPEFKKLLAVSKISDHNTIEDILRTKQWKKFYKNLKRHTGPAACWQTCRSNKNINDIQELRLIDTSTNAILHKDTR